MPRSLAAPLRTGLLVVLLTLAACVVLLELGLRVAGRLPSNTTDGFFEQHGSAFRLRKNFTKVWRTPSYVCTIQTNSFGLRDRAPGPPRALAAPYYAFVGDSMTFANGVDWEDSFVGVFERLAAPDGVGVVNLAVGGHHLVEQQELLDDFLAAVARKPSWVVVVLNSQFVSLFDVRYTDVIVKDGFIFRSGEWLLPYLTVTLGNTSSAYCFFRDAIRKVQARLMPSTGAAAARAFLEPFLRRGRLATPETAARLDRTLDRLDAVIRGAGSAPVYVYVPTSAEVRAAEFLALAGLSADDYDFRLHLDRVRRHCERAGVPLVDLLPAVQALHAEGRPLSFSQDMHFDAPTNRAIGEALHQALRGGPGLTTPGR